MNEEEIKSRILICEIRERDYREVGNTKTAERYNQEKYKWEVLLDKINPKNYEDLQKYKYGCIRLDKENQQLKEQLEQKEDIINKTKNKLKILLDDLKINSEKEKEEGKSYFNNDLFIIRVNEIKKILDNKGE